MTRVVVLGCGVGGTFVANRLFRRRPDLHVIVIDSHGNHLYQPGFVRIPFEGETIRLEANGLDLLRPGVGLMKGRVAGIDRDHRQVRLESGQGLDYDWLVIATGSRLDHSRLPGSREAGHNFHCRHAAHQLRRELANFRGGRIVLGAASLPYKCPPSIFEFTFLLDQWLRKRRLRASTSLTLVYPHSDLSPYEGVARIIRPMLEERDVEIHTSFTSPKIDPSRNTVSSNGHTIPFELLVMVPPHAVAPFLRDSDLLAPNGWVRTHPSTLRAEDRIYALGDTANLPRPKSGSAAHAQAAVVVDNVIAEIDGEVPRAHYDGSGVCFMETGHGRASMFDFPYAGPRIRRPGRWTYWKKAMFSRLYFRLVRRA